MEYAALFHPTLSDVYGDCYAANKEIYFRIGDKIKNGVLEISDIEFSEINELGRVNKVDPMGITNLRIRGMWHIDNPLKVFKEKFDSFSSEDKTLIENNTNVSISSIKIKNPDNSAQLLDAKLIIVGVK